MKLKYFAALLLLFLFSHVSFAAPEETGEITFLQVHSSGGLTAHDMRFIVRLDGTISETNCSTGTWQHTLTNAAGQAMYSTLLAKQIAGGSIKLTATSSTSCSAGNLVIRNLYPIE